MQRVTTIPTFTWPTWQAEYRPGIRVNILWDRIQRPAPVVDQFEFHADCCNGYELPIYYPWYKGGDSRDGKPIHAELGDGKFIVRVPALYLPDVGLIVLDGCHRIHDLKPQHLVLDTIQVKKKKLKYFNDVLHNELYRKALDL